MPIFKKKLINYVQCCRVEYDEGMEEVTIELDETQQFSMDAEEEEDETELGGAFSFMANHMDV